MIRVFPKIFFVVLLASSCVPREAIVLRSIDIKQVDTGKDGQPLMKADAIFYNPNSSRMRLKQIKIDVMVEGKKAARVDQHLSSLIKANSEFTVPLEVLLNLKEVGLLDTILSLFGGKEYKIQFVGTMRVKVNGFPVKVPVDYTDRLKF